MSGPGIGAAFGLSPPVRVSPAGICRSLGSAAPGPKRRRLRPNWESCARKWTCGRLFTQFSLSSAAPAVLVHPYKRRCRACVLVPSREHDSFARAPFVPEEP